MASDRKAPEVMESQVGEEGKEWGDELSSAAAPSVETTVTHVARSHSADRTPRCPVGLGFPAKYGPPRRSGRRTPEHTTESLIAVRIRKPEQILGRFDQKLTVSQYRQQLAFSSLPTEILFMAQELVKVKIHLKSGVQIVGGELARIDEQVQLLHLESHKVQGSFTTQVAERLGETDKRQGRQEAVTSHLHKAVRGTGEQSINRDLLLDQEIVQIKEQHKREWANHEISINILRDEQRHHQQSLEAQDSEITVLNALVEQLMGQVKAKGCQIRHQKLEGREGEDHHHHHGTEQLELLAEVGAETLMMWEKDLKESQMRVGKEDRP